MKNLHLLTLMAFITINILSCGKLADIDPGKKDNTGTTGTPGSTSTSTTYFFTYKAEGVAITATDITGVRGSTTTPRTLTITATGKDGALPKYKFYLEEPQFGFTGGTSVGSSSSSFPRSYIEYTDKAGTVFHTKNNTKSAYFGFLNFSYTNGGEANGAFDGDVVSATGAVVHFTEGTYRIKFSN